MNTEPPEGDDLQRMLVSMKQTVLERATPRPRRRPGRAGVAVGIVALLAVGTATGAVALSLSHQDRPAAAPVQTQEPAPAPSATTPTSAPITATPRPTPRSTPSGNAAGTIPGSCRSAVPSDDYERFFGTTPLTELHAAQTDSADVIWAGGAVALTCTWADPRADVSGLTMTIGTAGPEAAPNLASSPLDCSDRYGGRVCQGTQPADPYPVDQTTTYFVRGDTFVVIRQTNFPTNGLLDAVVGEIWGD